MIEQLENRQLMTSMITAGNALWYEYDAPAATGTNPQAVMDVIDCPMTAGIAVDVRALNSVLGSGSLNTANFQWNFGDSGSQYNQLAGFNASHVYTAAGTYTVSLTVTNNLNQTSTVSTNLTISPDNRRAIYVNALSGNDIFGGQTPSVAVQSAARAQQLAGNNTEIFFDRGMTYNLSSAFKLNYTNILVGAYGTGAQPIINYTDPVEGSVIFTTNSNSADGVTIQDLTLTALNAAGNGLTNLNPPMGVNAGGFDTTVQRCTFANVEYAINGNSAPTGCNVINNTTATATSVQGYFVWDQGFDTTVIGNTALGSVHEHIMRTSSASEILAYDNNFTNSDGKGCIEIHEGSLAWIDSNTVTGGDIRVGPLGLWNEPITSSTNDCVIQNNLVNSTCINVYPGSHSISIRNNIIRLNSGRMIDVRGQDGLGRQSSDIEILNNTGISTGSYGNFLAVENHTDGILLENNLLVEPNLIVGGNSSAPVYVYEANLSSFTYINGNVWQLPAVYQSFAKGGSIYVGTTSVSSGYLTIAQWNAESVVGTDYYYSVAINASTGAPSVGSPLATADAAIPGVFGDIDGDQRPVNGVWTPGAVQV